MLVRAFVDWVQRLRWAGLLKICPSGAFPPYDVLGLAERVLRACRSCVCLLRLLMLQLLRVAVGPPGLYLGVQLLLFFEEVWIDLQYVLVEVI